MTLSRDLIGYGATPPAAQWPGGARVAVQFVINYEEGAENSVLYGDKGSEAFLSDMVGAASHPARAMAMESLYEYGSRAGFWRLHRLFAARRVPVTVFGVAAAMELNPAAVDAMLEADWEIASHGYRWIDYQYQPEEVEREHIARAIELHTKLTGSRPLGWYQGRTSPNTARLVVEEGGFVYDADSYADDLPYWDTRHGKPQLIVPYSLDANDMKMVALNGFTEGEQFFRYLRDTFEQLREEGGRMMSVGLHGRIAGKPGRARAVARFLDHVIESGDAWIARRIDIARHWLALHPYAGGAA
ncbi:MAG: chitin deacetylase [Novosphingobium sp. 28-62-57]|uniref:allantoinase PuuE n=1 Tax=unclassified Novosphingobium TaxID=2644732 RepID=UPI000BD02676|nr:MULTISPECIES: allantoinase PuuE [unclassified Novosphingobium]OYW49954.1 MAG: chitin deacetylase [Novosphingobium sp. 12-62-10]OYZ12108.1 MAG: chitin deacetylase [Novosphingobium sp. 28-62-57]HQS70709.1 allantoinase PuuE [Novosphingobium sp.]